MFARAFASLITPKVQYIIAYPLHSQSSRGRSREVRTRQSFGFDCGINFYSQGISLLSAIAMGVIVNHCKSMLDFLCAIAPQCEGFLVPLRLMNYFNLPKIDLHCHLDGSVRPQTIIDIAHQQGLPLPSDDINEITSLMIAPETCQSLDEYLKRFELPLSVMQTQANIERISYEVFEDAARENVKYLELRFAPLIHLQGGLNIEQVLSSAIEGMKRAEKLFDIKGNFILSVIRSMPKDRINELIDVGTNYLNKGLVAFDLAGSEPAGFCQGFVPYAQYAVEKGYQITIHAGEQGNGQNVYDAVSLLGAKRIGHGIAINSHASAYNLVKSEDIVLESCPSSNIQTKAVRDLSHHPINAFYKDGVLVTINTDNRTVSNTTMTEEVRKVMEEFKLSRNDYSEIYKVSIEHSFASESVKKHLLTFVESV